MAAPMLTVPNDGAPFPGEETESRALVPSSGLALAAGGETASTAAAVQAKTQVEARYMMAMHNQRSVMQVRRRLLDACQRPRFAQTARYAKPVGGGQKIVGWSIRFAEECARCLGNLLVESAVIFDDPSIRLVRVMVTDLETNLTYPVDVTVVKTVERKFLKKGQAALRQRINSNGEPVYIVEATDDDILNKQNALVSKAMRTAILRVMPADILEEAEEKVLDTLATEDAKDPASKAKAIADAFYGFGVEPTQLEKLLGKSLAMVNAAEVTLLRTWATALKDGETTWREIEEVFLNERAGHGEAAPAAPAGATDRVRERLAAKRQQASEPTREREPGEEG